MAAFSVQNQAAHSPRDSGGFWPELLRSLAGGRRGKTKLMAEK